MPCPLLSKGQPQFLQHVTLAFFLSLYHKVGMEARAEGGEGQGGREGQPYTSFEGSRFAVRLAEGKELCANRKGSYQARKTLELELGSAQNKLIRS